MSAEERTKLIATLTMLYAALHDANEHQAAEAVLKIILVQVGYFK
jgi:hypothetical protein